jgi:hypothetical protein
MIKIKIMTKKSAQSSIRSSRELPGAPLPLGILFYLASDPNPHPNLNLNLMTDLTCDSLVNPSIQNGQAAHPALF